MPKIYTCSSIPASRWNSNLSHRRDFSILRLPNSCSSIGSVQTLRSGGRWFDTRLRKIFFPRFYDGHCDRIHSSLTAVHCFDDGQYCTLTVFSALRRRIIRSNPYCSIVIICKVINGGVYSFTRRQNLSLVQIESICLRHMKCCTKKTVGNIVKKGEIFSFSHNVFKSHFPPGREKSPLSGEVLSHCYTVLFNCLPLTA